MLPITASTSTDDVAVCASTEGDLQYNLNLWNTTLKEYDMNINKDKTKVMVVGDPERKIHITLDGTQLEQVDKYTYLGVNIDSNGNYNEEINSRVTKTLKLFHIMKNSFIKKREISIKTKIKVYNTIYKPILTFRAETWVLNDAQRNRIQATEMLYLRAVNGVTRMDRIRNDTIRHELQVLPVLSHIEEKQLQWFGHLQRMKSERITKRIWQAKTQRKRHRGRPKMSWNDEVRKILNKRNTSRCISQRKTAKNLAMDRKRWAEFVHQGNGNARTYNLIFV